MFLIFFCFDLSAEEWPQWRGQGGNAVSRETDLPVVWSTTKNIRWKHTLEGEGSSSPIVYGNRVFLTSALEQGTRRRVACLDRKTGAKIWQREIEDKDPEITSALTGHAAATPVTDGKRVAAFFGNAGVVCYDVNGRLLWRRRFGQFESELGLASSPIIDGEHVILLCDHDGKWFDTFDSFLIALDLKSGDTIWKTNRRGLFRSWSTPLMVPLGNGHRELIINAQDEVRSYSPNTGKLLWSVQGMTGWVTPSPVYAKIESEDLPIIFASSGKDGPAMAVRPGGRGDVTKTHVLWKQPRGAPYVCSPLYYRGLLYLHDENGVLRCLDATNGEEVYRKRLGGKFKASAVAADGKIYFPGESGTVFVIHAGREFRVLAKNQMHDEILASPAISNSRLLLRTSRSLYCVDAR